MFNRRLSISAVELEGGHGVRSAVLEGYRIRDAHETRFEFGAGTLDGAETVVATLADGTALPAWLAFDPATLRLVGTAPEGTTAPVEVALTFTRPGADGPVSFTDTMALDPAALATGVDYDSGVALLDLEGATVAAQVQGGRPLPDWLRFDAATRSVSLSGFEPDADAQPVRLQVVFTPPARNLADGVRASTDRGFTLEFLIGPETSLAEINAVLAGEAYFAEQGLFALDLTGATVTAKRESGAPLNPWLDFDAADLSFAGTPPPEWVGAVPVRMDVAGGGLPAMSIITEVGVDDTFRVDSLQGLGLTVRDERITLNTPKDFNGTVVFAYDTTDEKGAVSDDPALIFFNVRPTRERPDAGTDAVAVDEGDSVRFAVAGLLANDFDRDGDAIRVTGLGAPAHGTLVLELAQVAIDPPAALAPLEGATWSATLADGSGLPAWLTVDAATGALGGEIPLAFAGNLAIRVTRTLDGVSESATFSHSFDGNAGAFAVYTPAAAYSGEDSFSYAVTDGREGSSTGKVNVTVNPLADPPTALDDFVSAQEDTPRTINPATLLANDYDVDSDPIRFLGVSNARHGTVSYDGEQILFTPDANFSGNASFEYQVTDDRHGVSTAKVTVVVASTNRAPTPGADVFEVTEDTPFTFTIADLMANDSDPDGDTLRFQSIKGSVSGGRILELPGGRYQFVPDENVNGPLGFSYVVSDGRRATTASIRFDIAAVNDAPIANDDGFFAGKVDQDLVIDLATLIANDRDVEGDTFSIVELFDGDQGIVTRVGNTAVFSPDGGYFGDAGFHYRVTDSHGASSVGYVNLTIHPEFPLPIASSDHGLEMLEDGFIDIDPALLMANDTAPDGSTLSFVTLQGAVQQADGRYRFTPGANFFGDVTLRYAIENEQGFPVWSTVTISVLPVEDAPVAGDDGGLTTVEDETLTIFADRLLANDRDADPQAIFIAGIIDAHGVTVTDLGFGQLAITPDADFNGTAWFDYELSDSTGRTDVARVTVEVTPDNDPPVIAAIPVLRGLEDLPFSAALPSGLVTDVDGDIVQVTVRGKDGAELPAWLHYDAPARALSGNPPADFNGTVALEVVAFDGALSTVREVIVSIEPVNDRPVVASGVDDVAATEDAAFAVMLRADAFADVDGDALTLSVALADGTPAPAWLTLDQGVLSGTPPADFTGEIALAITASDGELSVTEPFALRVAPVNDAPVVAQALGDAIYDEDSSFVLTLPEGSFADIDGDALTLTAALAEGGALPAWLEFDGSRFTGNPPADFHGELDVRVTASDGALSASDVFRLTILPVNDAPAVLVPLADLQAAEDIAFSIALPTSGIADVDGDALTFSVLLADGSPLPGWLSFTGTHLEGTAPADFNGRIDLQLVASDGALTVSDPFSLLVSAVNDAPVVLTPLADLSSPEDAAFDFAIPAERFADVDGDALTLSALLADGSALPAWLAFDGSHLTGTPPADFNGVLAIAITASDGTLSATDTFQLAISAVNDAPVLLAPLPDYTVAEDTPISFTLPAGTFGDVDGDSLAVTARLADGSALPAWLSFDGTSFSGQAPANFNGALAITVTASDGALSVSDGFVLTVAAVNDPPVLLAPFADLSFDEDTAFSVTLDPARFADVDGDALALSLTLADGSALPEWLTFDGTTLSGTPLADWNGSLALRITASDGTLSASDTFALTIAAVNDAPVVAQWFGGAVHSAEDAAIDLPLPEGAFADVDGDTLTTTATLADGSALPAWLAFDGARFTGTPPANFHGALALLVTASDGALSATAALQLVIDPVNDRPVLVAPLADRSVAEDTAFAIAIPVESFADVDGDPLALSARLADGSDLPAWLVLDGTTLQGTPPQDFNGSLDIEVMASDGALGISDVFRLTVTPVNDPPAVLVPLADLVTAEDHAISLNLPTNGMTDVDGDTLAFSVVQADGSALPSWLTFTGSRLEGTPPANFNGRLDLQLVASDGQAATGDPFSLTILAVNDAPVVLAPLADRSSAEDTAFAFTVPAGTFGDIDGDALALSARLADGTALPLWLTFDGATFTGTPPANFNGLLEIAVTANDGLLAVSETFVLTIDPVNDAPVLLAPLPDVSRSEDGAIAFALPAGAFADADGDGLTFTAKLADGSALPAWLAFDGSAFAGTPPADFNGTLAIAVTASDGAFSVSDTFELTLAQVNDAPVLTAPLADVSFAEDSPIAFALPAGAFTDADGDALSLTAKLADGSALPAWLAFAGSAFTGTPPTNFTGALAITVTASDGALSASDTFYLTVGADNDAPVLLAPLPDVSVAEDSAIAFALPAGAFADVDGDPLSYTARLADGSALPAWLAFDGSDFTGTPPANFTGILAITVTASDGVLSASGSFDLSVTPVNDAPVVAAALADQQVVAGAVLDWTVPAGTFADVDGDTLALSATRADGSALPAWLSFSGGRFTGTAPAGSGATLEIRVTASDGTLSAADSFLLTVTPTEDPNDAPVAVNDGLFVTTSNRQLVIDPSALLANDTDADGDTLTVTVVGGPSKGEVTFGADGNILYTPDAAFVGLAQFTYTVSDGTAQSTATVSIRIDPSDQFEDWRSGNAGNNILLGSLFGTNRLFGDAGDDALTGGLASDQLSGGDGNDLLLSLTGDDHLWGGQGNDILFGGGGFDTAYFFGYRSTYVLQSQGGLLTLRLTDGAPTVDGNDGVDQISSIERLSFKGGETLNVSSPIILDLAGDGIETLSAAESNARFDLDGDGLADDTSWIGAGEGFLYLDRDDDGTMSGADEITFIDDLPNAPSDLAGLRAFDSNNDGKISSTDARFADFGVWRDADGDGAVDVGETFGLSQAGIASIGLTGTAKDGTTALGEVAILNTGSFITTGGQTRGFADAAVTYFSAASNLPELTTIEYTFGRKAKKYVLTIAGGTVSVAPKKDKGDRDPLAGQLGANTILHFGNKTVGVFAPVVLDLNGDGVKLVKRDKSDARFDLNDDGTSDDTGWVAGSDGFLVIDRNNDGKITEASELSLAAEDEEATSGLDGLRALDSNRDGRVDDKDARFGELRVWQDVNGNGTTEAGELRSLAQAGIVSIRLGATALTSTVKIGSNALVSTTTFTRADGSTSTAADAILAYTPSASGPASSVPTAAVERLLDRLGGAIEPTATRQDALQALFDRQADEPFVRGIEAWLGDELAGPAPLRSLKQSLALPLTLSDAELHEKASLARKLAMIRQDIGTFGVERGELLERMLREGAQPIDWHA